MGVDVPSFGASCCWCLHAQCLRELLEEAFDVGMYHIRCALCGAPVLLLISCAS